MWTSHFNNSGFGLFVVACYAASAWLLFKTTLRNTATNEPSGSGGLSKIWLLALVAASVHALMLAGSTLSANGLNLSFFNALSVTAWLAVVLTLLLNIGRPVINLGLFLFPMAAAAVVLSLVFTYRSDSSFAPGVQWHVLISVVAYALLTIATGQAALVAVQDKRLKNRQTGGLLQALPPLKVMETVLFQLLLATFVFLSLALVTGLFFLDDMFAQRMVHKTTLSVVAWCLIAVLLIGHLRWGWRGQKAAGITIGAFFSLLLGYFGSKFVIEVLLG
ncbi:MAG: cytochrome c biogenesis protein CcsA [Pseudomonadota bacterium]